MIRYILALAGLLLAAMPAAAQTSPGWTAGQVPSAAQWNAQFSSKADVTALSSEIARATSAEAAITAAVPGLAPVQSVAGRTGAVTISASDVGGLAPSATTDTTNAGNISAGTLPAARLSGVPADSATVGGSALSATMAAQLPGAVSVGTLTASGASSLSIPVGIGTAAASSYAVRLTRGASSQFGFRVDGPSSTTISNATISDAFRSAVSFSGTTSSSGPTYNTFSITDNVGLPSSSGAAYGIYVPFNYGGSSFTGQRSALEINMNHSTASPSMTSGAFFDAAQLSSTASAQMGTGSIGYFQGLSSLSSVKNNINVAGIGGYEVDVDVQSGSTSLVKFGVKVVQDANDAAQGSNEDFAFGLTNSHVTASPGWNYAFLIGESEGQWPMSTTATLIGTRPPLSGSTVPYNAAYGVDFSAVTFSGDFLKSAGFTVDGAGNASVKSLRATGAVPTLSGTCSTGTQVGGNTAGSFKFSAACSAGTVILTFASAAPNGWACHAQDMTTPADTLKQTAYSTTSATFAATAASGDQAVFQCTGF